MFVCVSVVRGAGGEGVGNASVCVCVLCVGLVHGGEIEK